MKISEYPYLLFLMVLLAACGHPPNITVADRVAVHLGRTIEAHQAASDLWDRLLEGERVNCQETFDAPPLLVLSAAEIQKAPQSVEVQTPLNIAIADLQQLLQLWETECQQNQSFVAQDRVRIAQDYLRTARLALEQAVNAWHVWQP